MSDNIRIEIPVKAKDIVYALDTLAMLPKNIKNGRDMHAYVHESVYSEEAYRETTYLVLSTKPLDIDGRSTPKPISFDYVGSNDEA